MNAESPLGPDRFRDVPTSRPLGCDLTCSDAELYDLLFHYRRIHVLLIRYRAGGASALAAVEQVLARMEGEARRRGVPLPRLSEFSRGDPEAAHETAPPQRERGDP